MIGLPRGRFRPSGAQTLNESDPIIRLIDIKPQIKNMSNADI